MKYVKIVFALVFALFFTACATTGEVSTYKVGDYEVHIADFQTVNSQCYGFINYKEKEIWSIDRASTVIHEFKHMMEGNFHSHGKSGLKPTYRKVSTK
ncbi:MAG: hypothetical protein ACE5EK_10725 [Nitrospinales bacterium]